MRSAHVGWTAFVALLLTLAGTRARAADGLPCDDGDACNGLETYDATTGTCVAGTPPDCDDGNPCTDDTCSPSLGCQHPNNTSPCDDGNACTLSDQCDGNGRCVGAAGVCSDGNACNGEEQCDPATGLCVAGAPPNCDDNDACTFDTCVPATGCVSTPIANYLGCSARQPLQLLQSIQSTLTSVPPRAVGGAAAARRLRRPLADAIAVLGRMVQPVRTALASPTSVRNGLRRVRRDVQRFCGLVLHGEQSGKIDTTLGQTLSGACRIFEPPFP